jgi:hypothetical protein
MSSSPDQPRRSATALAVLAQAQVALVFLQAVFAGLFLSGRGVFLTWHENNANLIFLVALAEFVLALVVMRRGPRWPALATGLIVLVLVAQISSGYARALPLHVPLGVAIFGVAVGLRPNFFAIRRRPLPVPVKER